MDEAVIVVADLYLQPGELAGGPAAGSHALAGLEHVGRFGERERLARGWREWLTRWLGRGDLAGVSVAAVAAAALAPPRADGAARWIATPVQLVAGLTRVHLDRRGIVRLAPPEQAALAEAFERDFGGSGLSLQPLSAGDFLAVTPGIPAIATSEPARCAGGGIVVPHGPPAAQFLRLVAEIEMWLHGTALNAARAARGAAPVTGLWLWGAAGAALPAATARRAAADGGGPSVAGYGSDAFLSGLLHIEGRALEAVPERTEGLFRDPRAARAVVVVELAGELPGEEPWVLPAAAAALDRRLIRPALEALRDGSLRRLTLLANDTRATVRRYSGMRRWRRPRAGLAAFA